MNLLEHLNQCAGAEFVERLGGIYEHSPWVPEAAIGLRPFASIEALRSALVEVVAAASADQKMALIRAHPELAGKAALQGQLTRESSHEQSAAGLDRCTPEEFNTLQTLNAGYNAKFGFPFILAVRGPDGQGLTRQQIIALFTARCEHDRAAEIDEALRQIHLIAGLRIGLLLAKDQAP